MNSAILEILADIIRQKSKGKSSFFVALDGRCGAGKTTLAGFLSQELGCLKIANCERAENCPKSQVCLLHMDDFFLRPEQRTEERLSTPGGNVDYERFLQELLLPLSQGKSGILRRYNCHKKMLEEPIEIKPRSITIVEGSYSCHRQLWEYYDMRFFLEIDREKQLQRILGRNGEEGLQMFQQKWIPLEEAYFMTLNMEAFDYRITID